MTEWPMLAGLSPRTAAGRELCASVDRISPELAERAAQNDAAGTFAADSIRLLEANGILAACARVDDGGGGLQSLHDLMVLSVHVAQVDASVAVAAYMHLALSWYFARTVRCGTAGDAVVETHRQWSKAIGGRRMIVCSAVAEPGVGPWHLQTTARRTAEGWSIDGRKVMASISPLATHFYARLRVETEDGAEIGSVMIPRAAAGVEVIDNWNGLGLRGSGSGEVLFRDCHVPADAVSLRGKWGVPNEAGFEGRVAASAPLLGVPLGIAEAARSICLDHITRAYPDPDGAAQIVPAIRQLIADMELRMASARAVIGVALLAFDARLADRAPRTLPASLGRELMKECVSAGMIVERAAIEVVDIAMQVCGGASFHARHPLARMLRDVRAISFMRPYAPASHWSDFLSRETLSSWSSRPSSRTP
jgi:alkylation response protein AidB-like acyl-CoA dehydrogenase